ncbi:MAG: hypothetical protein HUJ25_12630 [Crocinitomicaceae bacterium]|nr:hypothetical protein [Crocinitomicaceae bacterium]
MKEQFIKAIRDRKKVRILFSANNSGNQVRLCAPLDINRKNTDSKEEEDTYKLWDLETTEDGKEINLPEENIQEMEFLKDEFDPTEFSNWDEAWNIERDWSGEG